MVIHPIEESFEIEHIEILNGLKNIKKSIITLKLELCSMMMAAGKFRLMIRLRVQVLKR